MTAQIIDGKAFAEKLRKNIAEEVAALKKTHGVTPGLAVVLVGADPASQVYVRNKKKAVEEAEMASFDFTLPADTTRAALLAKVKELNADKRVHGILVQLPLPRKEDEQIVIETIDPAKDVDGFHPINVGRLATGQEGLVSCTPLGCLMLLRAVVGGQLSVIGQENASLTTDNRQLTTGLQGLHAVVIGRSNIVGKPMAQLLLKENCTVTVCHSKTKNIEEVARQGDILVAAIGKPGLVKKNWIKSGAVVIDVGINRIDLGGGKTKLVGDVAFEEAKEIASAITPVPGGVGPMTIACLLYNTLRATRAQHGIERHAL